MDRQALWLSLGSRINDLKVLQSNAFYSSIFTAVIRKYGKGLFNWTLGRKHN